MDCRFNDYEEHFAQSLDDPETALILVCKDWLRQGGFLKWPMQKFLRLGYWKSGTSVYGNLFLDGKMFAGWIPELYEGSALSDQRKNSLALFGWHSMEASTILRHSLANQLCEDGYCKFMVGTFVGPTREKSGRWIAFSNFKKNDSRDHVCFHLRFYNLTDKKYCVTDPENILGLSFKSKKLNNNII